VGKEAAGGLEAIRRRPRRHPTEVLVMWLREEREGKAGGRWT
jgi:hypothetical protein